MLSRRRPKTSCESACNELPTEHRYADTDASKSVGRELISLALPVLGASIVQLINGSINASWVGRYLGDTAFAAVANANTIVIFLFSGAFGVWMALTIRTAFHLGAGRVEVARQLVRAAVALFASAGVVVAISLAIFSPALLRAIDVPGDSVGQASQYLRVILLSVPVTYVYGAVVAVLRGVGDTKTAWYFSLLSIAIDAALNPVFIFGIGWIPRCGVAGSALATVLGQMVGLTALVIFLRRRGHPLCLRWGELIIKREDWARVRELLRQGGPMAMENVWNSALALMMMALVNEFGSNVTAAYGAVLQVWGYLMLPAAALSVAGTSMAAQSVGASRWDRVRAVTRVSVAYSLTSTAGFLLVLEALDRRAFELFLPVRSPALAMASEINRDAGWSCVAFAGYVALLGIPRAAGAVWGPLAISTITLGARLPVAEVLLDAWKAQAVWWSILVSGIIAAVAAAIYYLYAPWRPPGSYPT